MPITKSKILFELDLSSRLSQIPRSKRTQAKSDAGVELLNAILADVSVSKSPVNGGRFEKLSKEYKKIKKKKTGRSIADLRLKSDMLNSLIVENSANGIRVKITDSTEKKKAFNHNTGDTLPPRKFIPDDAFGESFRPGIIRMINNIVDGFQESA